MYELMDKLPIIAFKKKKILNTVSGLICNLPKKNAISHVSGALRFIKLTAVHFPSES